MMSMLGQIDELRDKIDRIDRQILSLVDKRMSLAVRIGNLKRQMGRDFRDSHREALVLEELFKQESHSLRPEEIEEFYSALFRISRSRQGARMRLNKVLLCITVLESTPEHAKKMMQAAAKTADLVELRLDKLETIHLDDFLPFSEIPCIVTNRRREEGGYFEGREEDRISVLNEAMSSGAAYVDVEWRTPEALRNSLLDRKGDTRIILSYHDVQRTPTLEELLSLWEDMSDTEADLIKIVPTAETLGDSLTLLRFLLEVKDRGGKVIAHSMGEAGRISRIMSPLFGSFIAYATLQEDATVQGQMNPYRMQWIWEAMTA